MTNGKDWLSEKMRAFSELPITSIQPESEFVKLAETLPAQTYTLGGTIQEKLGKTPTPDIPADPAIPDVIGDVWARGWWLTGVDVMTDFWGLLFGSAEDKLEALKGNIPLTPETLEMWKQRIGTEQWAKQQMLTIPGTTPTPIDLPKLPDLKDIGKWLLIGAAAIGGLYLLGRYLGRSKSKK